MEQQRVPRRQIMLPCDRNGKVSTKNMISFRYKEVKLYYNINQ